MFIFQAGLLKLALACWAANVVMLDNVAKLRDSKTVWVFSIILSQLNNEISKFDTDNFFIPSMSLYNAAPAYAKLTSALLLYSIWSMQI